MNSPFQQYPKCPENIQRKHHTYKLASPFRKDGHKQRPNKLQPLIVSMADKMHFNKKALNSIQEAPTNIAPLSTLSLPYRTSLEPTLHNAPGPRSPHPNALTHLLQLD